MSSSPGGRRIGSPPGAPHGVHVLRRQVEAPFEPPVAVAAVGRDADAGGVVHRVEEPSRAPVRGQRRTPRAGAPALAENFRPPGSKPPRACVAVRHRVAPPEPEQHRWSAARAVAWTVLALGVLFLVLGSSALTVIVGGSDATGCSGMVQEVMALFAFLAALVARPAARDRVHLVPALARERAARAPRAARDRRARGSGLRGRGRRRRAARSPLDMGAVRAGGLRRVPRRAAGAGQAARSRGTGEGANLVVIARVGPRIAGRSNPARAGFPATLASASIVPVLALFMSGGCRTEPDLEAGGSIAIAAPTPARPPSGTRPCSSSRAGATENRCGRRPRASCGRSRRRRTCCNSPDLRRTVPRPARTRTAASPRAWAGRRRDRSRSSSARRTTSRAGSGSRPPRATSSISARSSSSARAPSRASCSTTAGSRCTRSPSSARSATSCRAPTGRGSSPAPRSRARTRAVSCCAARRRAKSRSKRARRRPRAPRGRASPCAPRDRARDARAAELRPGGKRGRRARAPALERRVRPAGPHRARGRRRNRRHGRRSTRDGSDARRVQHIFEGLRRRPTGS